MTMSTMNELERNGIEEDIDHMTCRGCCYCWPIAAEDTGFAAAYAGGYKRDINQWPVACCEDGRYKDGRLAFIEDGNRKWIRDCWEPDHAKLPTWDDYEAARAHLVPIDVGKHDPCGARLADGFCELRKTYNRDQHCVTYRRCEGCTLEAIEWDAGSGPDV